MSFLAWVVLCVIVGLLAFGIVRGIAWDPYDRRLGMCTACWSAVALYLFIAEWLPSSRHYPFSVVAIGLVAVAGYLCGRVLVWLTRWEWIPEDLPEHRSHA